MGVGRPARYVDDGIMFEAGSDRYDTKGRIEVTEYGLVRIDRAAYSVDTDELIRILASQREPGRRSTTDTPTKKSRPPENWGKKT